MELVTRDRHAWFLGQGAGKWFLVAALCVHVGGYFILNMVNIGLTHGDVFLNDFYLVFVKGVNTFLSNPGGLYDAGGGTWLTGSAYRNLPALVLFHLPFVQLGPVGNLDLIACSLFIVYFNLGSCFLVFKIASHEKVRAISKGGILASPHVIAGGYALVTWHYFEYYHAHTQAITAFFVIAGMYFMLREQEHYGFASWSAAAIFKLPVLLWIGFLIVKRPLKRFVRNVAWCVLPQVPNIIMFIAWPKLLLDFIPANVGFSMENAETFYIVSGTISREIARLLDVPITGVAISFMVVFVPLTLVVMARGNMHLIDRIMLAALTTITVLPDFWTAHALYVIVPYLFWLSVRSPLDERWKLVCFVPLMFAAPWFLLIALNLALPRTFPTISILFFLPLVAMICAQLRDTNIRDIRFGGTRPATKSLPHDIVAG